MTDKPKTRLRFGSYELDMHTRELRKSGVRVKLSGQPLEILTALLERPGQLVSREELRKRVWAEDTFVDFGHGLNAAMNKLREALCDSADEPRYIETLPRRGYRFIATIEEIAEPISTISQVYTPLIVPPRHAAPESLWKGPVAEEDWQTTIPVKRQTLVQLSAFTSAVLLLALGITAAWWHWSASPSPEEMESRVKQAVEPFAREAAEQALKNKRLAENPLVTSRPVTSRPENPEQSRAAAADPVFSSKTEDHPKPAMEISQSSKDPETFEARRKTESQPDASDDESFLRLEHSRSAIPTFFRERAGSENPAILRGDLSKGTNFSTLTPIVVGREAIAGPQPSPDGSKLVFMAGRNDSMDIWVSNADGSSPRRLTNTNKAGTPRWSPDGRWIAFDSDGRFGRSGIYVVSVDGGPIRSVVDDGSNNSVPSWSRDGRSIYFASNRGSSRWGWESDQIWKVPAEGGEPVQITRQGGFSAYESMDGKTLYYAKSRNQNPEIWQVPVSGGTESRVTLLHPSTWASWALTKKGILLLSEYSGQASELQYFDFATHGIHSLANLEKASFWLASSANGSSIWYSELTDNQARQVFKAGMD
jgi:DNA-binding winged helix-turn-helix (wHTH) protein